MKHQKIGTAWPLAKNFESFMDWSPCEIISNKDINFKNNLKKNVLRIVGDTNKSFQDKVDAWHHIRSCKDVFGHFLKAVMRLALSDSVEFELTISDRYQLLTFLNYTFNSIEIDFVQEQIKKYLPLSIWINLSKKRRDSELSKLSKRIRTAWRKLEEQDKKMDSELMEEKMFERKFMFNYVKQFFRILQGTVTSSSGDESNDEEEKVELSKDLALYCQRFLEFIIDIESQLVLRRFFHAILEHTHFIVRCQLSDLAQHRSREGHLFAQLVELLLLYSRYQIDLMTGEPMSDVEILKKQESNVIAFQKVLWLNYPDLKKYAVQPIRAINPSSLYQIITSFNSKEKLFKFLETLGLADEESLDEDDREDGPLMATILMNHYKSYVSQLKKINSIPLFPNESVIWDTNLVPDQYYNYEYPLALPKLNLQFLTMSDYLLRNFMLFKNESTYEIRQDLEDGITRSKCRWTDDGHFATGPKQRLALIIKDFKLLEVGEPRLGENCPSMVKAKILINMDYVRPEWRREWEQLRKHDTCFLVSFKDPSDKADLGWPEGTYPGKNGIKYVRGCEIEGLLDSDGKIVDENLEKPNFSDNIRTFLVNMDCNQFKIDQDGIQNCRKVVYGKFHLMVRRKPEKNNFKGVLETIRSIINTKFVVPDWLRNLLIGLGDPTEAHHSNLRKPGEVVTLDYYDTFLDYSHLTETMSQIRPDHRIVIDEDAQAEASSLQPPFKIRLDDDNKVLTVIPYQIPSRGPYPTVAPKWNTIRYTPAQVESITSGLQTGLTMVVGPPGTGKTDVAVQILSTLYHSYPEQRTLIVTHSNQALNQIFEKMIELDVKEHHLLRLGHGEEDLQSTKDFSRQGRVKHVLTRKLELLIELNKLTRSIGLDPGSGLTCQSAEYFHSYHIISRWQEYLKLMDGVQRVEDVGDKFPFVRFFDDAPQPLFKRRTISEDLETAHGCYRYITQIFDQLKSFRPFEIFTNVSNRSKYLLIREAKVIAMTCTHAGLRRKELVEMNFQYDNILMEETAQILEIETTIPLLLQNPENGVNRLKRWIMIGDHNQLPPIIQNTAFQKFSNMEQSLFARFIRLGVPAVQLDAQGRARSSLCDLYRWRYNKLRELEHVQTNDEFKQANAGFVYEYQMINVEDHNGAGETAPMPYFYQNRGEAEYVMAVYKYMRMLGYPNDKITILTTYNGQKELLRELVERECTNDAYIGMPSKVTTVDKFQGQQNDYILLSLVRTRTVGHLRNVKRLVVAMSRARLGLYVFGRASLFGSCYELQPSLRFFLERPLTLRLVEGEQYGATSRLLGDGGKSSSQQVVELKSLADAQQFVERHYAHYMELQARRLRSMEEQQEDEQMEDD